jgi:hypothetical protein
MEQNITILIHTHRPQTVYEITLGYTRKNAQVVTNLQQQDVFALLVPSLLTSCQRLVDNLLQGC